MSANSDSACPPCEGICSYPIFSDSEHTSFLRNKKIIVEENKKKYIANNIKQECIAKVRVDGGLISNQDIGKSDYILIRCEHDIVYIIELKGCDVAKACEQILSTIAYLSFSLRGCTIHGRIICSRAPTPALRSSHYTKLERQCRENGGQLIVKTNQFEEMYGEL